MVRLTSLSSHSPSLTVRSSNAISSGSKSAFYAIYFRVLQLLVTVGLILCIIGGTDSFTSTGYQVQSKTKIGTILYCVAYAAISLFAIVIKSKLHNAPSSETRLAWAPIIALPFILIRLLYAVISIFGNDKHFNLLTGSVIIHVFMAVLEEMLVVGVYLFFGWITEKAAPKTVWSKNNTGVAPGPRDDGQSGIHSPRYDTVRMEPQHEIRDNRRSAQYGNGNGRERRQGPIH